MKKLILGVLVATIAFLNTNAQENKKGPKIEFTKDVHDYGTIENGADGTCEFKFKNTGKEDLKITNCRASCGCTVPSWPREAIKKGKTGVIKVKYDTKRTGMINKTITITSNAVNAPNKVVRIKGKINPPKTKTATAPKTAPAVKAAPTTAANAVATPPPPPPPPAPKKVAKKKRWWQFWKKKN